MDSVWAQSTIEGKAGTASGENAFVTAIDDEEYVNNSEAYIYTPEFDFEGLGNYEFAFEPIINLKIIGMVLLLSIQQTVEKTGLN